MPRTSRLTYRNTVSITGWRSGHVQAAPSIIAHVRKVHGFLTVKRG